MTERIDAPPTATWIALLRAVTVGGPGKLPMTDLRALCEDAGFTKIRTCIASGNVIFDRALDAATIKTLLQSSLIDYARKVVGVVLRIATEMVGVLSRNPFPHAAPNRAVVIFLDDAPRANVLADISGAKNEVISLGAREIYFHYAEGARDSRLNIPAAKQGTARNLNTVAKLVEMSSGRST